RVVSGELSTASIADEAWGEVWGVEYAADRIASGELSTASIADQSWGEVWGVDFDADLIPGAAPAIGEALDVLRMVP
nr:hypothetical protein [Paracoccaceae bacterium]